MSDRPVIAPGATLGVLGGGQLGRMFVHAAQRLGYRCAVLDPDVDSPAGRVAGVESGGVVVMPALKVKEFTFTSLSDAV